MENDSVYQLIKQYKSHRLLWDSKHPEYYNKNKRDDNWLAVSVALNVPAKELRKKMTSLLGSYRREKSREKRSQLNGHDDGYKSKWFAFKWLKFLADKEIPNDTTDTMDNDEPQCYSDGNRTEDEPISQQPTATRFHECKSQPQSYASVSTSTLHSRKKRKHRDCTADIKQSEIILDAYMELKKRSTAPPDHYESFGKYVTGELRKYDFRIVPHVKRAIMDVLFRADLGEFSEGHNPILSAPVLPTIPTPLSSSSMDSDDNSKLNN